MATAFSCTMKDMTACVKQSQINLQPKESVPVRVIASLTSSSQKFGSSSYLSQQRLFLTKENAALIFRQNTPYKRGLCVAMADNRAKLSIKVPIQVQFGEKVAIAGSAKWLGSWQGHKEMKWTEEGWIAENLSVKQGDEAEFKFLIVGAHGGSTDVWENGNNRKIKIPSGSSFQILATWDKTDEHLEFVGARGTETASSTSESEEVSSGSSAESDSERSAFASSWQGKEISFMRSNNHSGDRNGVWNVEGLEGPGRKLVEGDKNAGNWWQKLEVVQHLLESEFESDKKLEALSFSAVYLQWINTGQIVCVEGGGHHRPNKHAEISRRIFRKLEQHVGPPKVTQKETLVIRKIHPRLPSFTAEFTASVPLTRIRDIAHRNDIPHDLKQEIKHTIQNKLHRNAGPEDLVATEALLQRVKGGDYSSAFVEQLSIFYKELKDFFNASTLTEQLEALRPSLDDSGGAAIASFLAAKQRADALPATVPENDKNAGRAASEALISALHTLTGLRAFLLHGLESGLRNDASDHSIAMRQKWRLAEIGLEDYSFVLLSRFVNTVESLGGAAALADDATAGGGDRWSHCLGATVLGLRQLGLSGWLPRECAAVENELDAWQKAGLPKGATPDAQKLWALRLKATLDRTRRVSESYTESLLQLFSQPSEKLGKALGIPENTVKTFSEAEIRASVVFQLAKLCSLLLKSLRQVAQAEGWDVIMPGTAVGTLVKVDKIVPGSVALEGKNGPIILLVKEADGDEEVKAAGPTVAGVILCHELPHLSHLGVRARQERVAFVTCEDDDRLSEMEALLGQTVSLEAFPESVKVSKADAAAIATAGAAGLAGAGQSGATNGASVKRDEVVLSGSGVVIPLADADVSRTGSKAASCGQLARLALASQRAASGHGSGNGSANGNPNVNGKPASLSPAFKVPAGAAIPFGAMEAALSETGKLNDFKRLLRETETAGTEGGRLDAVCDELRALIGSLQLPEATLGRLRDALPSDRDLRLIVRSSANVEDLAGMSGAGLYDSIPNVRIAEPREFSKAVARVWGSLFTRRAVLSRRAAGVSQSEARMAVLVQELLAPRVSFVLHTRSPVDGDEGVVQAEIAMGLGETLASGTRGSPWRLAAEKSTNGGSVRTLAFANFSEEMVVGNEGSADGAVATRVVDYSRAELSVEESARKELGRKLASIGEFLEREMGCAQDVEGCVVGSDVYIVQLRPQP